MYVCIQQIFVSPYVSATPTWSNPKLCPKPGGFVGSETGSTHMNFAAEWFVFRIPVGFFLQVKAATRSTPCGLMRLLDDCFIFTEMISNQFELGTLSRDLQSLIRPKWCIFSSIKCMIGCPLKGLGYLFRVQSQPQPHRKRWKRWQKFHNMGLRWLPLEAGKIAGHSGTSLVLGMGQKLWQNYTLKYLGSEMVQP